MHYDFVADKFVNKAPSTLRKCMYPSLQLFGGTRNRMLAKLDEYPVPYIPLVEGTLRSVYAGATAHLSWVAYSSLVGL